jgi:hypothetical protein
MQLLRIPGGLTFLLLASQQAWHSAEQQCDAGRLQLYLSAD